MSTRTEYDKLRHLKAERAALLRRCSRIAHRAARCFPSQAEMDEYSATQAEAGRIGLSIAAIEADLAEPYDVEET